MILDNWTVDRRTCSIFRSGGFHTAVIAGLKDFVEAIVTDSLTSFADKISL
jgi:hypothetical protein